MKGLAHHIGVVQRPTVALPASCRIRWLVVLVTVLSIPAQSAGQASRSVPSDEYYLAKDFYYSGEYRRAERGFQDSLRSGVRIGDSRWIDSICYLAMLGECYYHRGQFVQSLQFHEQALKWFLANRRWLHRIQFPQIQSGNAAIAAKIGWGQRATLMARLPRTMGSAQGTSDVRTPFEVGGVVNPLHLRSVDAAEVARCIALSLRRRAEMMGPAGRYAPLSATLTEALAAPANTAPLAAAWSEVLYGLALLGDGQQTEALAHLSSGITVGNVDHQLTGIALLEIGKLTLRQEKYNRAAEILHQASLAAARYRQADVVEDAFRYLTDAYLAGNAVGLYPPVAAAVGYAESEDLDRLAAALLAGTAELAVYGNEPGTAAGLLNQATRIMARRDLVPTDLGARVSYLTALTQYRAGNKAAADVAMKSALAYMQRGSFRRFHLAMVETLHAAGRKALSPRRVEILFSQLLREPSDVDWRTAPLESITMLLAPHTPQLEKWFELLVDRKEYDEAVRVAEQLRRHRFYSTLPFGGRILSLRWLIEGDAAMLGKRGLEQQQGLLKKYPQLGVLSRSAKNIQEQLRATPLLADTEEQVKAQRSRLTELARISQQQENIVREIALRREPARLVFPPQPSLSAIKKGMAHNQAVLMFVTTARGWHCWFIRKAEDRHWPIRSPQRVRRALVSLLRSLGNRDRNGTVAVKDLKEDAWKQPAQQLWKDMIGQFPSNGWEELEELVIVPDGILWYLPFEILQVPGKQLGEESDTTLIDRVRVRYAPTTSLALGDLRGRPADMNTTVVGGQLFPRESSDFARQMLTTLKEELGDLNVISKTKPAPSGYIGSTLDRLIVWNDINNGKKEGPYGWAPAQYDRGKRQSSLAAWIEYPWGSPDQIILPGFHTAAEASLGKDASGHEVFLAACALMASGTRTALLSRWRVGGSTPATLVREFASELGAETASLAWQKAVNVVREESLDPTLEPRIKRGREDDKITAGHPFFWSGYLLLDTGAVPNREVANIDVDDAPDNKDEDVSPEEARDDVDEPDSPLIPEDEVDGEGVAPVGAETPHQATSPENVEGGDEAELEDEQPE